MGAKTLKLCAWSGVACIVLMALGFAVIAGFIPPPSPNDSVLQTARLFIEHKDAIRIGMILSMISSALLMPFAVSITVQMRRIEGPHSPLAFVQLGLGSIFVLEFIYLIFFWQVATFRADRAPEIIQLLNDMAWIPFVGLSSTLILQSAVFGWVILTDRRERPILPRWLGYFNIFAALMFVPGTFNVFFKTGPFAWDGLFAFYIPVAVFVVWLMLNSWFLVKAVDQQVQEAASVPGGARDGLIPNAVAMASDIAELRKEVERLSALVKSGQASTKIRQAAG